MNNDEQQVIALAATVQALSVVQEVAVKGQFDEQRALPLFRALITYSPDNVLQAYGNDSRLLSHGLKQLHHLFSDELDRDLAQYLLAVISIELKLVRNTQMRQVLQSALQSLDIEMEQLDNAEFSDNFTTIFDDEADDTAEQAAIHHSTNAIAFERRLVSADMLTRFADIYKQTASQIEPRIMIKGNHTHLQNETSANQIRAVLLAALRGAAFFRHYDGKRVDFMLKRSRYLNIIKTF